MTPSRPGGPYQRAHWYVAGLVVVAAIGFWREYVAVLGEI